MQAQHKHGPDSVGKAKLCSEIGGRCGSGHTVFTSALIQGRLLHFVSIFSYEVGPPRAATRMSWASVSDFVFRR